VAVNRTELVDAVAAETGLERKQAEAAVKAFSEAVVAKTKSGEKVSIFGFGTFKPTDRAARMGRNPQTRTPVKIAASKGVKFSPAAAFKTTLNTKKAAPKKTAAKKTAAAKAPAKAAAKAPAKTATAKTATAKATAVKKTVASKAPAVKKTVAKRAAPVVKKVSAATTKAATKTTKAAKTTKKS
jgi:DNA-binding protein HU-beta